MTRSPARRGGGALTWLSAAVLLAALVCGGGTQRGHLADAVPELLSLALIVVAAPRAWPVLRERPALLALLVGVVAVPMLHLIPLPPGLWTRLPGRDLVAANLVLANPGDAGLAAPWLPLTLRPGEAWRAGFALLPGVGLCLAALTLDGAGRRRLLALALAVGLLSVPIAMLQILAAGADSPLDFFAGSGPPQSNGAGFFENPNHFATLLAVLIPLAAALAAEAAAPAGRLAGRRPARDAERSGGRGAADQRQDPARAAAGWPRLLVAGGLILALLIGLSLTGSRSVLPLGGAALALTLAMVVRADVAGLLRGRAAWALAALAGGAALALALSVGLAGILGRLGPAAAGADLRWTFAQVTAAAVWRYFPIGSGVGSFEAVYQVHEPLWALIQERVNHAHNDWLEAALEAGLPGVALMLVWLVWLVATTARTLRAPAGSGRRLARAAVIGLWLISLHAAWDYPLRTIAVSAVFGLLVGLTVPARPAGAQPPA